MSTEDHPVMGEPDHEEGFDLREHLATFGEVAFWAGHLEFFGYVIVRQLLGGDRTVANAVTHGLTFDRLLDLAGRLGRELLDPHGEALRQLTIWRTEARAVMRRRNELIHGMWLPVGPETVQMVDKRRVFQRVHLDELRAVARDLSEAAGQANRGVPHIERERLPDRPELRHPGSQPGRP